MNFKDFLVVLLSLLIFSVSPSQAEEAFPLNDKQKHDEIKARQRIIDIDLKKDLEAEQVVSHEYYAETSAGNVILLNSTEYVTQDYSGDIKILGKLQNVGNSDVSFVKITYTFRDASNALLDTEFTYVYGSSKRLSSVVTDTVLSPDEIGSFELYTDVPYNLVSSMYYTISFENYDTNPLIAEIILYGELVEREDSFGELEVLGELKNVGSLLAYFVKFVSTAKNNVGQVIDVDYSYIDGVTVELNSGVTTDTGLYPDQIASFKIYSSAEHAEVDNVTYKINWDEGNVTLHALSIDKSGDGKGLILSNPAGLECGSVCSFNFAQNTLITLSADADPGDKFSGWSGEGCSGTKTCTVIMDSNKSISATFIKAFFSPWIPLLLLDDIKYQ
jgi:hypothetical protein